jgi:hypothetical protein
VDKGRGKDIQRKITVVALSAMLFALYCPAEAQQPKKVSRLGYLSNSDPARESARFEEGLWRIED